MPPPYDDESPRLDMNSSSSTMLGVARQVPADNHSVDAHVHAFLFSALHARTKPAGFSVSLSMCRTVMQLASGWMRFQGKPFCARKIS